MRADGVRSFLGFARGLAVTLPAAARGAWLLFAHTGHTLAALPYLLLLLCPLLHFFGHGHGHRDRKEHRHD